MSTYIPLYRKYRPQMFADLVGQESVVKTLSNAINTGRISHAYLFTGPRGTGKTSSARILAKSLNCVEGPTVSPCGKCPSCVDIANSNSVDVIEIDAASNRKVEDARNLLEKVHFVPVSGKYKVYIIDEVHMLTTEAFNTLLKTLEEPPKNLVFILATTEAHKVLNTIISRCQRFDFKRVPHELIIKWLKELAKQENINITDKALSLIAKKAYGGMRDALGLLDQASVLANQGTEITESDIITLFGSLSEDTLYELANNIAQRNTVKLMETADTAVQSCEPVNVLREMVNYFRNLLIIKTSPELDRVKILIDLSDNIIPEVKAQSEQFETDEIVQIIEKLSEYERTIKTTQQQQLWLEVSLLSICHRQDMQVLKDLNERIERLEAGGAATLPQSPQPQPQRSPQPQLQRPPQQEIKPPTATMPKQEVEQEAVAEPENVGNAAVADPGDPDTAWSKKLASFKAEDSPTLAFYRIFKPVEISSEKVVITCANEKWVEKAKAEKMQPLESAAQLLFNTLPKIIIRTPLPGDKTSEKKTPDAEIITKIEPPLPKQTSQIAIDVEERENIDEEVRQELEDISRPVTPVNVSDQCKMVLDIFGGKVIQ